MVERQVCMYKWISESGWKIDLIVLNLDKADYVNFLSPKINIIQLYKNHVRNSVLPILKYIYKNKPNLILALIMIM